MAPTYLEQLTHFLNFLTAYTHTILYLRNIYPKTSFLTAKFHNTPVHQSRHPAVCTWITDAVRAVREELLKGTVERIAVVIYHAPEHGPGTGSAKVMERYMLDVSQFPVVAKGEREMELEWDNSHPKDDEKGKGKQKVEPLDAETEIDLSEQFRAALIILSSRCSQFKQLPSNCSFNIALELKDQADVDPPIGHPQAWVPVQPSLQKTGRRNAQAEKKGFGHSGDSDARREGQDLDGVRTTPIRTVTANVFQFETWVEESKAKFEVDDTPKSSSNT